MLSALGAAKRKNEYHPTLELREGTPTGLAGPLGRWISEEGVRRCWDGQGWGPVGRTLTSLNSAVCAVQGGGTLVAGGPLWDIPAGGCQEQENGKQIPPLLLPSPSSLSHQLVKRKRRVW